MRIRIQSLAGLNDSLTDFTKKERSISPAAFQAIMDANREARELDVTLPDIAPWASEGYNNAKIHSKHRNLSVMNKTQ